jgi:hypothetical protein
VALHIHRLVSATASQSGLRFSPGRTFHCAMEVDGAIHVFDIWGSMDEFEIRDALPHSSHHAEDAADVRTSARRAVSLGQTDALAPESRQTPHQDRR